jgi:hypothetical protein
LQELAVLTGRAPDDLIEDVAAAYLLTLAQTRETLDAAMTKLRAATFSPLTVTKP